MRCHKHGNATCGILPGVDPAEAIASTQKESPSDTPAPAVVAWLSNPAPPVKPKTPAQILIEQIERGDVWNHAGEWQGRGPEPEKEDPTP